MNSLITDYYYYYILFLFCEFDIRFLFFSVDQGELLTFFGLSFVATSSSGSHEAISFLFRLSRESGSALER